jgi:hypothetical protein
MGYCSGPSRAPPSDFRGPDTLVECLVSNIAHKYQITKATSLPLQRLAGVKTYQSAPALTDCYHRSRYPPTFLKPRVSVDRWTHKPPHRDLPYLRTPIQQPFPPQRGAGRFFDGGLDRFTTPTSGTQYQKPQFWDSSNHEMVLTAARFDFPRSRCLR